MATHPKPLLAGINITERSRKFYDGTYQFHANGFIDDVGMYRDFDCLDPAACAPTPLPPTFPDDSEDEGHCEGKVAHLVVETSPPIGQRTTSAAYPHTTSKPKTTASASKKRADGFAKSPYAAIDTPHREVTYGTEGGRDENMKETPVTPGRISVRKEPVSSPMSDLSDCSSELLGWRLDERLMKTSAVADKPTASTMAVAGHAPKRTSTTRGVAQKVGRTPTKTSGAPATNKTSAAAPSRLSMAADDGGTSRRRSARLR